MSVHIFRMNVTKEKWWNFLCDS